MAAAFATAPFGATLYNNLTPTNGMAVASRPSGTGAMEIEAGDDFILTSDASISAASLIGLLVPGTGGTPVISDITLEFYRVFPFDSNTVRTPAVPTRANSPSDVAFQTADSAALELTFSSSTLSTSFTALNSVQPGGIHASPNQTTGGNGTLLGAEVQIDATLSSSIVLPAGHYFLVPQVMLTNGGQFYWLSASRPISGAGTTSITPDLQAWTRDANLNLDWLRVGTDIVGGTTPPTFNMAFSLTGTALATPEPGSFVLAAAGVAMVALIYARRRGQRRESRPVNL